MAEGKKKKVKFIELWK